MTDKRELGRSLMREVLGEDYMAKRDASTNELNRPLREFSEANAFGDVWQRPGLDHKTRSLLCICMLTALNRPHEVRIHVNSAVNNGATLEEIREALYQTVIYCGIPAAIDSTVIAEQVLKERGLL